mgnify:CR=1 FL=1
MYLPQYTERKGSKIPENGQTERPDTLRNQQVMCSSHTTSSKKHRKLRFSMLFCCKNAENGVGQNMGQLPDPNRDPHRLAVSGFVAYCQLMPHGYNEMRGKSQRAPERKLSPFRCSACLWDLSDLCHEAAHFLRGLLLHLPCDVGVGAEGESRVVVTQHTADGFDVPPVLQCQGRECVSQVVKPDMLQPRVLEDPLVECYDRVGVIHFSCSAGREHPRIVGVFGVFLFQ